MTPKELLFAHRYSEAVEAHQNHMIAHPEDNYNIGLGLSFMCLKRFPEALSSFRSDNEIELTRRKGSCSSINRIGTALWLMGKKTDAMQEWHRAASGILDGSIYYGDAAGGAIQGLLLWYAAVTLKDTEQHEYALKYLRFLNNKKVYGSAVLWPRPIVAMILVDYSFEKVLEIGIGSCNLDDCLEQARIDLIKRRRLCQILFYAACRERECGNEAKCISMMLTCCNLENPIIETEWYLARNECHCCPK